MMMDQERIGYLDLARGFCICIVMLFHIVGILQWEFPGDRALFSSFMLPPFFFISGFLYKEEDSIRTFFIKKVNRLLVPFLFFYLITSVIIPNVLHYAAGMDFDTVAGIKSLWAFVWPGVYPNVPLWFLWCLFLVSLLFRLIHHISRRFSGQTRKIVLTVACFCLAFPAYVADYYDTPDVACLIKTLIYLPFFCVGFDSRDFLTDNQTKAGTAVKTLRLITCFLVALLPLLLYGVDVMVDAVLFYISGLAGSFFVVSFSSLINRLPVISYLGRNSIVIILTHGLLIRLMAPAVIKLSGYIGPFGAISLCWLTMTLSYLLITPVILRLLPRFTGQKPLLK